MQSAKKKISRFWERHWKVMEETCSDLAPPGCGTPVPDVGEESPAGLVGEEHLSPCIAGDKGTREQQTMGRKADGRRNRSVTLPLLRAARGLGSGWARWLRSWAASPRLCQPQVIHWMATDSLLLPTPAETLMDSTTATAELGWTVHPPSGVSDPGGLEPGLGHPAARE